MDSALGVVRHPLEFTRDSVLLAAFRAAPHVPRPDVATVVAAVTPLVAANTRRDLLAVIAQNIREGRPA